MSRVWGNNESDGHQLPGVQNEDARHQGGQKGAADDEAGHTEGANNEARRGTASNAGPRMVGVAGGNLE